MHTIENIDKNLAIETAIKREGLTFFDVDNAPFQIYGVWKENGIYRRMPEAAAEDVSAGVLDLSKQAAGGRVRFVTDSPYIAIQTEVIPYKMPHYALSGSAGYDMFVKKGKEQRYAGSFIPPFHFQTTYESVKDFEDFDGSEQVITLNMPPYSTVKRLYIGIKEGSVLKAAPDYRFSKPVVFYGSSITQGACASKPGSTYQNILSRKFDFDYVNLGFSGNAKGEDTMTAYIKGMDMSVFVMDYDHNANSLQDLKDTHSKMFFEIRKAHPTLPIIIMPRPKCYLTEWEQKRYDVIYHTYLEAKERGDESVYFVDNKKLTKLVEDSGTVDGVHPSDSGFFSMALALEDIFQTLFLS